MDSHRTCTKCGIEKALAEYRPSKTGRGGFHAQCRECACATERAWYVRNAPAKREYVNAWRDANRERDRERDRSYKAAHAAEMAAYRQRYYELNAERLRAASRQWARDNPAGNRQRVSRYHARRLKQFIEDVDPRIVYEMHGGCCGICHEYIDGPFHVDHVIPTSRGGLHGYVNVQPAHPRCNQRKYNKL